MKVLVGMSGGVDSSVAALLLKEAGHDVTGVTMRTWVAGRYAGGGRDACFGAGEIDDIIAAAEVCRRLEINYHAIDCSEQYDEIVVSHFRKEYLAGRTPNPCVRCNALVKFGLLPDLARSSGLAFDRFATGHYARTDCREGRNRLLRATDTSRDQSYFLYRLTQEQLGRQLFPLGTLTKTEVRAIAVRHGLAVAERPDSQDFYSGDRDELIGEPDRPGDIVDEDGHIMGHHTGFWKYTIGQRKGLGIAHPLPLYVVGVDACRNQVIVATAERTICRRLVADDCNWVSIARPDAPLEVQIKVRSAGHPMTGAMIQPRGDGSCEATFAAGIPGVAPGQSAVFYCDDIVLGGGIIREAS